MDSRHTAIIEAARTIGEGFAELRRLLDTVDDVQFAVVRRAFEELEKQCDNKTTIDAAFAYIATRDDAGRYVGSTKPADYLIRGLGVEPREAYGRLELGELLYGCLDDDKPLDLGPDENEDVEPPVAEPVPENESEQARREREAREEQARREYEQQQRQREAEQAAAEEEARKRRERERVERERLREELKRKEAAQRALLEMIRQELKQLRQFTNPGYNELMRQALDYAKTSNLDDTRAWLRKRIGHANANAVTPRGKPDPHAATRNRSLWIGKSDSDGGARFGGYLDAVSQTMLRTLMKAAARPGFDGIPEDEDTRSREQRYADVFTDMLAKYMDNKQRSGAHGFGSVVISATLNQLNALDANTTLPTTVGTELTPHDLARLGAAVRDFLHIVDERNFHTLALGSGRRTASFEQRIALAVCQMACAHPGCNKPAHECEAHHDIAWSFGGPTDLNNLVLLCPSDHRNNNDFKDGRRNMGHAERDSKTGLWGWRHADGRFELNNTVGAKNSALRLLYEELYGNPDYMSQDKARPPGMAGPPAFPKPPDESGESEGTASDDWQLNREHNESQPEAETGTVDAAPADAGPVDVGPVRDQWELFPHDRTEVPDWGEGPDDYARDDYGIAS